MKRFIILSIITISYASVFSQETTARERTFEDKSSFSEMSIPAPQERVVGNRLWEKTVWRMIDMREQINYPLYYPLQEIQGRTNLFMSIFNLLKEDKVSAYEYFLEKETFTEDVQLTFEDILKDMMVDIYETSVGENGKTVYEINDVDVPSSDILKFYIKEVWYFDAMESAMKFKIEAIAPQLYYFDEDGKQQTKALFWIPFDQLRPWLAKQPVVINNKNSSASISYDDLFQKRRFQGHIYKEDNLQNRALIDYCHTPDEVHSEQLRIENEILNFESDLWEY